MKILNFIRGDKGIWAVVLLMSIISFLPVFSASTNLVYVIGTGSTTIGIFLRHVMHLFIGFGLLFVVHKVPYHYFKALSKVAMPIVVLLLLYTLMQGNVIGGANASRWIQIPFVGFGFQTSTLAFLILMTYVARYLAKVKDTVYSFKDSFLELWIPVGIVIALILPANLSTAALMFLMVCMLVYIGEYPLKYLGFIVIMGIASLFLFILVAKAFPDALPNRVDTWVSRFENYTSSAESEDAYQIEKAKIAIASGQIQGLGPGKSVQKNFLPQSSSDFIFAIIVEEYGLIGAITLISLYLLLFYRFIVNAHKAQSFFGKMLIVGLGFPIIFQAFVNMGVAVELLPVTGQPLPLISSGGTSIWMTCIAIGVILSVTKKDEEILLDKKEQEQREAILKDIIDREVALQANESNIEKEDYSIEETHLVAPILNEK
jgi:cell division protein FtsW